MTAHVCFSLLTSCFFPRSQSWADYLLDFKVSLWLSFCSFPLPVDLSPGTGTLNVSVSQEVPALCPRCHVWCIFYAGDPFSLILLTPCAHFPCHRSFRSYSLENCGAEAALSGWAFPPCTPPPHTSRGAVPGQVHPSGSCFLKTVRSSTSSILHAFVLAAWLPKPIPLTASRWQHVPPSALRLD